MKSRGIAPLLCALGLTLAAPVVAGPRAEAYVHFLRGKQAFADANYALAMEELKRASALDPADSVVPLELAEVYVRVGRNDDALAWAKTASARDPSSSDPLELMARLYELSAQLGPLVEVLERLSALEPTDGLLHARLADTLVEAGKDDRALEVLERGIKLDPASSDLAGRLAERYISAGRFDRAIPVLERAAALNPSDVRPLAKLAECYLATRDLDKTRATLAQLSANATNVNLLLNVARTLGEEPLADWRAAARAFLNAVALRPEEPGIRVQAALALMRAGEYQQALEQYRRYLALLKPDEDTARYDALRRIAALEMGTGENAKAVESLRAAEPLAPADDWEFTLALAHALARTGDLAGALAATGKGLEARPMSDPTYVALWTARSAYLVLNGQVAQGVETFTKVEALHPIDGDDRALVVAALVRADAGAEAARLRQAGSATPESDRELSLAVAQHMLEAGEKERARAELDRALARNPSDLELGMALARLHELDDDHAGAAQVLETVVGRHAADAEARFRLGGAYERLGRLDDAERELERAIELDPRHARALNYLGYSLADRGVRLERARELIERALEQDPDNGAYLDSLGWVYHKLGRLELAADFLEKAAERIEDAVVLEHLGDVYRKLGRREAAIAAYERGLKVAAPDEARAITSKLEAVRLADGPPAAAPSRQ